MTAALLLAGLVLLLGLAAGALPTAGFAWDFLGALGFSAFAVIAMLGWDSESPARQPRLDLHRNLGIAACVLVFLHGVGYLLIDWTVIEYLLPAAPGYMLLGVFAFLALLAMTITSLPRFRSKSYGTFATFRNWHRVIYLAVLAATAWHVLATDFSLASPWQPAAVALLLCGVPLAGTVARRLALSPRLTRAPTSTASVARAPYLMALGAIGLALAYAAIKQFACASC
ncbi:MAG: ferric reductase-like transmembrane domain-containing protein [Pseudomonadota bacterium]